MFRGEKEPTIYDKILKNPAVQMGLLGLSFMPFGRGAGLGVKAALRGLAHNKTKYLSSRYATNVGNRLEGFYAGGEAAKAKAMAKGFAQGVGTTAKQMVSKSASKINRYGSVAKKTLDVNKDSINTIRDIVSNPKNWNKRTGKLLDKHQRVVKTLSKTIQGQNNTQIALNERFGIKQKAMEGLKNIHFYGVGKIPKKNIAKKIYGLDKTIKKDVVNDIYRQWKLQNPGQNVKVAFQKATRLTNSLQDAQMNHHFVSISNGFHVKKLRSAEEFTKYFAQKKVKGIAAQNVGGKNIMFTYSPNRRSDFYKGGFNVRAILNTNTKKVKFLVSDKFDLGGKSINWATEKGMEHKLLNVMKHKEIIIPKINRKMVLTDIKKQKKIRDTVKKEVKRVKKETKPWEKFTGEESSIESINAMLANKSYKATGMAKKELVQIQNMIKQTDVIKKGHQGYDAYFYGTRAGLPLAAGAGLIGYAATRD